MTVFALNFRYHRNIVILLSLKTNQNITTCLFSEENNKKLLPMLVYFLSPISYFEVCRYSIRLKTNQMADFWGIILLHQNVRTTKFCKIAVLIILNKFAKFYLTSTSHIEVIRTKK